jgi:hypothetical protein
MTLENAAERLEMLKALGDETTATIGAATVYGVFNNAYTDSLDIEGTAPSFVARTTDVSSVVHGTTVTINSTAYVCRGNQADGLGLSLLILQAP